MGEIEKAANTMEIQLERAKRKKPSQMPYILNAQALFKYKQLGKKNEAKEILENLLREPEKLSPNFLEQTHTNYGIFKYYEGEYKNALHHYLKALQSGKKIRKTPNT